MSVANIEEEALNIADKDGWITRNEFIKFALETELCKVQTTDSVFSSGGNMWGNSESEPKTKSKDASKKDTRKVSKC